MCHLQWQKHLKQTIEPGNQKYSMATGEKQELTCCIVRVLASTCLNTISTMIDTKQMEKASQHL